MRRKQNLLVAEVEKNRKKYCTVAELKEEKEVGLPLGGSGGREKKVELTSSANEGKGRSWTGPWRK
jgi:hypothetical protein